MKNKSIYDDVIILKNKNKTNKEISNVLGISLNTVEKSLQLNRLHMQLKNILSVEQYDKLLKLNYKALDIKELNDNTEAIKKLIDSITYKTTSKELKEKIQLVKVRQEKVIEIKDNIENIKLQSDNIKSEIKKLESEYKLILKEIDSKFKFIQEDPQLTDEKKKLIFKCIAYDKKNDEYVFVGFIDKNKYFYLKNKKLIKNINTYSLYWNDDAPIIPDINKFIQYIKRSKGFDAEFQDKYTINQSLIWANQKDIELKNISKIKKELKQKKDELTNLNKTLKKTLESDLNDFSIILEAKNELSQKDILNHNELCIKGMKYLKSHGYISDIEYSCGNYRFDVIGINLKENKVVILEAKVSINDYRQDDKKENYIDYCNELYIITNNYRIKKEAENDHNIMGVIYIDDYSNTIEITKPSYINTNAKINIYDVTEKIYSKYWNRTYKI